MSKRRNEDEHTAADPGAVPTASYGDAGIGPGATIGPYKLLRILGEGGYGIVYLAEQQRPVKRRVALKVIKPGMDSKQVIARFEAERQALALLDHPNIAHVFNAGATEAGRPYFAMEYVKGVPITEHCDTHKLTIEERLALFLAVCEAVQHAHQKAIIHRDIKPSNILVSYEGKQPVPVIIDFGVAKALSQPLTERTLVTEQAQIIGTPEYMSPEQADMTGQDIDTRTDIYSLGVLLYKLLTGSLPFDSQALREGGIEGMRRMIRDQEPRTPSTRVSDIAEDESGSLASQRRTDIRTLGRRLRGELDWITLKAMEKDRARRYQTAHALAEDIERYLNQEPVLAGPPSGVYRLKKLVLRHRTQVMAAASVAMLLAALAIILALYAQSVSRGKEADSLEDREVLSKAQEFRSNGQFQEALTELSPILNSEHIGPEARLMHARLVLELEGPAEALEELQELLNERDEIACQAHFLLARIYLEGDPGDPNTTQQYQQKARKHQQRGEALFSESAEAYFNRAMLAGTVNKALECLDKALGLDPDHYPSLKARALSYYAMGDYRKMERDAVVMTRLREWDSLGHALMAIALRENEDFDEAIKFHNNAIEISAEEAEFYDQRRRTHMRMASYEQALADARTCVRMSSAVGMYHFHVFCALVALGRYDEANVKYDQIIESDLMTQSQFELVAEKYVSDMLDDRVPWHPSESKPEGAAFLVMHYSSDVYAGLVRRAERVVDEGFHPDWSPDGNQLVYSRGILGFTGIEVVDLRNGKTRLLTVPGFDPAWSPDGRYIAFTRDRRRLLLTQLTVQRASDNPSLSEREVWLIKANGTEEPRYLADGYWPCWSRDAKRVFYHSPLDNMLYAVPVTTGAEPVPIVRCEGSCPSVSPDGRYIVYAGIDDRIRTMELSTNSVSTCWGMPPGTAGPLAKWSPDGTELCVGGVGLWIYDLKTKTAARGVRGFFGGGAWSLHDTGRFAIEREYGGNREIWVASLDPNLPTTEALGGGQTVEEHSREMVGFLSAGLEANPIMPSAYLMRAAYYTYLGEYERSLADFEELAVLLKSGDTQRLPTWMSRFMTGLSGWAMHKYKQGAYEHALMTLGGVDRFRRATDRKSSPAEVAIGAMALQQLGRRDEAESRLTNLRRMFEDDKNSELLRWLCCAERLFAGENNGVGEVWDLIGLGKLKDAHQRLPELERIAVQQDATMSSSVARVARVLAGAYHERGRNARYNGAGYANTISDYGAAIQVDPNYARAFSDMGWLLASCPDAELRDEKMAIEHAGKACELTGWKDHRCVSTLAAVYAEVGDLDRAVTWQGKAAELLSVDERARWQYIHESRLRLFQAGKTYDGTNPWNPSIGGLVACWDFEYSDGKAAQDSSGNGLDGRLVGDAQIVRDSDRAGQVLSLDGDHDRVDCGEDPRFDITGEITVACWVKVRRFDRQFQTIISKGDSAWRLARNRNDDPVHFSCTGLFVLGNQYGSIYGKKNVNDGRWHHVVGVYDGTRSCLYIDGHLDVSSKASGPIGTNNWRVLIGANEETTALGQPDRSFDGLIDDVRVYDCALSEAEIRALYDAKDSGVGEGQ